ncbi:MAG: hypothetical protein GOV15_03440 [Candidatus Diapherotrites archaeon]|nr:hypothetical protein [Candidatus Diapherotrites archaeon]
MADNLDEHNAEVKKNAETLIKDALTWHDTFVKANEGNCDVIHIPREKLKMLLAKNHFPKPEQKPLRRAVLFVNDVSKRTCKNRKNHKE